MQECEPQQLLRQEEQGEREHTGPDLSPAVLSPEGCRSDPKLLCTPTPGLVLGTSHYRSRNAECPHFLTAVRKGPVTSEGNELPIPGFM